MVTLPSKKVLGILIVVAAGVVSIIIAFGRDKSSEAINFAENLVAGEEISIPENPNWQKDLAILEDEINIAESTSTEETLGVTGQTSVNLMSNYLTLKQSGNLNQDTAQQLIDRTTSYIANLGNRVALVTELRTIPDNGAQTMTDYGENLGQILRNNKPTEVKNELDLITKAVESRDPAKMEELDNIIAIYEKIENDLVTMSVPQTFVRAHLDMVNGLRGVTMSLKEIKTVLSDPIKGLLTLQLFQDGGTIFIESMSATRTFINQNNIIYKQGSGGYYLLYGI